MEAHKILCYISVSNRAQFIVDIDLKDAATQVSQKKIK